jgi:gliding motility-associated-like protein
MNKKPYIFLISLFFTITTSFSQQLVINEVSQGPSGTEEYVELIVVGSPSCNAIPTMDLRGYYIDDNNGTFAAGGGTGIAPGCLRFANIPFWSAIPYGTIIVIYNDADVNATMPPNDLSMTDGNCLLVIPISNTTLLESNNTQPAIGTSVYPTLGFVAGGNWTQIGMANNDDSFQTRDAFGNLIHSVSWANNISSNIIYFAGSAAGKVMSMTNSTNNNPFTQSNWVNQNVAGNETPGVANNAANLAWINSMNNSCVALQPFGATTASTNPGCACNGLASITPSGAIAPYTYTWAPSGGNASNASALCAGIYTVISASSNNCTLSATFTLTNAVALTTAPLVNNPQCFGATGGATINASGVAGPYTYTWIPAVSTSSTASGLSAGNYTVSVGAGACNSTSTITIASPPAAIGITTGVTPPSCFGGTGSATVAASGGIGGYTYAWSPSTSTSFTATGLGAGTQTITVTSGACSNSAVITVTVPPAIVITPAVTSPACFGGTGSATVTASGGVGGYTYAWSPSTSTSFTATGLGAGTQTITVTSGACSNSAVITVTAPPAIGITPAVTNPACFGGMGSATVTASGGIGGYTYSWSPSTSTLSTATGLGAGTQTITVTSGACSNSAVITVTVPTVIGITTAVTPPTCFGGTGSATVTASGGVGGYTYSWSPSTSTSFTATGLGAGIQTITVTSGACSNSAVITVTVPTAIGITTAVTPPTCFGGTGSASVTSSGGVGGYTYSWSPSTSTSFTATGLGAGTQTITVTSGACSNSAVITVTVPVAIGITTTVTPPTCFGGTGSATVTASGGTGGYTYAWSPSTSTSFTATGLGAGTQTITVTSGACSNSAVISVTVPAAIGITTSVTNPACFGATTGSATVTASGGTGLYTYAWNPSTSTSFSATGLGAGTQTITVTSGVCSNSAVITVTAPPAIGITTAVTNPPCFGGTGSASVTASGGVGGYAYTWNPSTSTSFSATGLGASTQTITVTSGVCSNSAVITVTAPPAIGITTAVTNPPCFSGTGSATVTASGGTGGYTYTWLPSGGNFSISPSLAAGNYTAIINDANNCTFSVSTIISQPNPLLVNVSGITVCKGQNGTLNSTVTGGQAPYNYFWNGVSGSNTLVVNPTSSSIYSLNVIDNNGCNSNIATALVYVAPSLSLSVSPSKTICATKSANLSAFASGGLGNYQFNWMPINVNSQAIAVSPQSTTIYSVTLSDNCSVPITLTTAITVESLISSTLIADNYAGCVPLCINFTNTAFTSTQNIVSSTWNFGDGTNSSLFNSSNCFFKEGNYTITNSFITLNGCVNTQTLINTITISTKPTADFYVSNPQFTFFKPEVTFQNFSTNATSYFWDFSGLDTSSLTEPVFSFVEPANYLITLIAKNKNCSDTALKTIECLPEFTFYSPNSFTPNDDDLNELFLPKGDGWVKESFVLTIFDRWGEQIFLTKQYDLGWNGKKNGIGNVVKNDLYVWKISLKDIFGKQHEFFGHIEVLK